MLGAIAGDVIGSVYERAALKHTDFPLFSPHSCFTDDTVLTVATAHALLTEEPFAESYHRFGREHPNAGYGGSFRAWLSSDERRPYGSWGNGSAMRVSPVGLAAATIDEALAQAAASASVTHDHPEGVRGAQAVALAVFLARTGNDKDAIRHEITSRIGYDLGRSLDEIRPGYQFDVSCQGSVPEAITAFLEADSVESAIRLAISLGGDTDTQAAIAGGIAEAYWGGVPTDIATEVLSRLPEDFRQVVSSFAERYPMRR